MGDSCCFPFSIGGFSKRLQEKLLPGVYIHSIRIGNNEFEDVENGFFMSPNKQVRLACEAIQNDPRLQDGYNALGFSQGGQFLRALAQRCNGPQMYNLITLGAQHQGVFGAPFCPAVHHSSCEYFRKLLTQTAYIRWVQKSLTQATYWHDPLNEDKYKNSSIFLADINNERDYNVDYVTKLSSLNKFVMVKFNFDTMVQPIASEWFGFYKSGQDVEIEDLHNSNIYLEDKLGLKQMDEDGKLYFLDVNGDHLRFTEEWFIENIIPFLKE
ncbi:palmitoyl-protein thioesterase 1-like [Ctenocephalides felis]|uniref:palmitoyl-protein thioesterase 1-like n=1 Tax=Ctenocephalides felis TaxID=7515 RepID=UPI000E6E2E30|nr:palmitoyl-protein thioesterase 1-like [Ctenocephalides felis]